MQIFCFLTLLKCYVTEVSLLKRQPAELSSQKKQLTFGCYKKVKKLLIQQKKWKLKKKNHPYISNLGCFGI